MSIAQAKEKLQKVNLAIKQVVESKNKSGATLDTILQLKEVKTNLTNLINEEAGQSTAIIQSTTGNVMQIPVNSDKELKDLATRKDVKAVKKLTGEKIKGTFTYLGEMVEVIDQRVNAIDSQIEIGESARWYLKADLYSEYGLQFDFEIALGKLKRRLFQEAADEEE